MLVMEMRTPSEKKVMVKKEAAQQPQQLKKETKVKGHLWFGGIFSMYGLRCNTCVAHCTEKVKLEILQTYFYMMKHWHFLNLKGRGQFTE